MMKRLALLAVPLLVACAPPSAEEVLIRSAEAYRSAAVVEDVVRLDIDNSGATSERIIVYRLGPGDGEVDLQLDRMFHIVARDEQIRATFSQATDRYAQAPYRGDFATALEAIGGREAGIPELAPIAMRAGKDLDAILDGFRFGVLEPLTIQGIDHDPDHHTLFLEADNGSIDIRIDRRTHLLSAFELRLQPPGDAAPIRIRGTFDPRRLDQPTTRADIQIDQRSAVATIADLESSTYPIGQPAPDLTLPTLQGQTISLAELRGEVVVLDFWATWCVPCWKTLPHLHDLSAWAEERNLPVHIWPLNTLETVADRQPHIQAFWTDQGFTLDTLLDLDDTAFTALHTPGLPSLVIIGPDGVLRHHVSGLSEDMADEVKEMIVALVP